jgi:RimJ/RimL family protein N-acetyltransferase
MQLETKRLMLRLPKMSDWKDVVEGIGDYDVCKNMVSVPYPYREKDALTFIKYQIKQSKEKRPKNYNFFLELKSEKKMIGCLSIVKIDYFSGVGETGSWVNKKYWKKGYMTEAKVVVNNFAFNKLKLRRLYSPVFTDNVASNATQQKMGYKLEGKMRKCVRSKATGKIHDENIYGLLKEDWKKVRPKLVRKN